MLSLRTCRPPIVWPSWLSVALTSMKNLALGLDAFHTKLSLTVGTQLTTQVTLQYELRGGHDYVLLEAAGRRRPGLGTR